MENKVLLILVDGMRPDALDLLGHPFIEELKANSCYTYCEQTVMPSVTLPCHMSLFHSVVPQRHGILTNTYVPQVRPIIGLFDTLANAKKRCGFFYNWEQLRDLSSPGKMTVSSFVSGGRFGWSYAIDRSTNEAIESLKNDDLDFTFLYMGYVDEAGHADTWLGKEYMKALNQSWDCIERVVRTLGDEYTVIVTADHGGHDRAHGTDMPEDMTVPLFIYNKAYEKKELEGSVSIIDIAPTIAGILGVASDEDWEGKDLLA
nr:alkaline phosphatase family protein [Clostridia bacterium]